MSVVIRRTRVSDGARALAAALQAAGVRAILSGRQHFRRSVLTINWGSRDLLQSTQPVLNPPDKLARARDKLQAFEAFRSANVTIPRYWTDRSQAEAERGEGIILERHTLTGQSGAGIIVKRRPDSLGEAPLYVAYVRKQREFRVHVFDGRAVAVQEKKRESDVSQTPDQRLIRNRANGWVFTVQDIAEPQGLRDLGVAACRALQLDFGAVDIILGKDDRLYVLEVNTAPGLESPTVLAGYVDAIKRRLNPDESESNTSHNPS